MPALPSGPCGEALGGARRHWGHWKTQSGTSGQCPKRDGGGEPPPLLKAINYKVPQKRERLILVGIRKDIDIKYEYPKPYKKIYNLSDALKKGELFDCDVPQSLGVKYPKSKKDVF